MHDEVGAARRVDDPAHEAETVSHDPEEKGAVPQKHSVSPDRLSETKGTSGGLGKRFLQNREAEHGDREIEERERPEDRAPSPAHRHGAPDDRREGGGKRKEKRHEGEHLRGGDPGPAVAHDRHRNDGPDRGAEALHHAPEKKPPEVIRRRSGKRRQAKTERPAHHDRTAPQGVRERPHKERSDGKGDEIDRKRLRNHVGRHPEGFGHRGKGRDVSVRGEGAHHLYER